MSEGGGREGGAGVAPVGARAAILPAPGVENARARSAAKTPGQRPLTARPLNGAEPAARVASPHWSELRALASATGAGDATAPEDPEAAGPEETAPPATATKTARRKQGGGGGMCHACRRSTASMFGVTGILETSRCAASRRDGAKHYWHMACLQRLHPAQLASGDCPACLRACCENGTPATCATGKRVEKTAAKSAAKAAIARTVWLLEDADEPPPPQPRQLRNTRLQAQKRAATAAPAGGKTPKLSRLGMPLPLPAATDAAGDDAAAVTPAAATALSLFSPAPPSTADTAAAADAEQQQQQQQQQMGDIAAVFAAEVPSRAAEWVFSSAWHSPTPGSWHGGEGADNGADDDVDALLLYAPESFRRASLPMVLPAVLPAVAAAAAAVAAAAAAAGGKQHVQRHLFTGGS